MAASSSVQLTIRPGAKVELSQIAEIPTSLSGKPRSMSTGPRTSSQTVLQDASQQVAVGGPTDAQKAQYGTTYSVITM